MASKKKGKGGPPSAGARPDDTAPGICLRGIPTQLEALLAGGRERSARGATKFQFAPDAEPVEVQLSVQRAGSATRLRVRLPVSTPPGEYPAELAFEGRSLPAQLHVERYHNLQAAPGRFSVAVTPGSRSTIRLGLSNEGNVACTIPKTIGFGVFEVGGLERSLSALYRDPSAKGDKRIDKLVDELARSHGLVRGQVEGPAVLQPGEFGELDVKLKWPDDLRASQHYAGTWPLGNLRVQFRIEVEGKNEGEAA